MALKLTNNATSTLSGAINAAATSLNVQTGDGALFPTLAAGDWFPATLTDAAGNKEHIKVSARVSDGFTTIVRAQEGTTARSWASGDRIDLRITAAALWALFPSAIEDGTAKASPVDADKFGYWDSVSSALRQFTWAQLYEAVRTKLGAMVSANSAKSTPVDADQLLLSDSAASNGPAKLSWLNLKAGVFAALGALINGGTAKATVVDADAIALKDSAASNATKVVTFTQLWTNYIKVKVDANVASAANFLANAANLILNTTNVWAATVPVNLGATLTGNLSLDFGTFLNAYGTATGNITFNAASNLKHQSGQIDITASGGDRTVAFNTSVFASPDGESLGTIVSGTTVMFAYCRAQNGKIVITRLGAV